MGAQLSVRGFFPTMSFHKPPHRGATIIGIWVLFGAVLPRGYMDFIYKMQI